MTIDVVDLLRELDFTFAEGHTDASWLLGAPDGTVFEASLSDPCPRLDAHEVRARGSHVGATRRLLVGGSATDHVVDRARAGEIDILTAEPLRLIHDGTVYAIDDEPTRRRVEPARRRPAWIRWAVERHLLLCAEPARQAEIAEILGTSQQSVSKAMGRLRGLVLARTEGFVAADRASLLEHWVGEYPGPGGQEFGWYSVDPIVEQVSAAVEAADLLGAAPVVSGDVAADQLAPWKLPGQGRIYLSQLVDLLGEGFVPAPVADASLITCIPRDPTVARLARPAQSARPAQPAQRDAETEPGGRSRFVLADAAIIYRDVLAGADPDSAEAAEHLAAALLRGDS